MDIHRQKAAEMFGVPVEAVTSEQRWAAKSASFGELHGESNGKLFAAMTRTARTNAQQRQYHLRGTLGALHMLPRFSPTAEDRRIRSSTSQRSDTMKMKQSTEDGSNLGLTAEGSLKVMFGEEAPKEEASRVEVRNRVLKAPEPMGKRPERMSYEMCADAIIRAYLTLQEKGLTTPNATNYELWAAAKKRWPEFDRWLGGPSGYQVAWASNVFRWLNETPPQPNPAIMVAE